MLRLGIEVTLRLRLAVAMLRLLRPGATLHCILTSPILTSPMLPHSWAAIRRLPTACTPTRLPTFSVRREVADSIPDSWEAVPLPALVEAEARVAVAAVVALAAEEVVVVAMAAGNRPSQDMHEYAKEPGVSRAFRSAPAAALVVTRRRPFSSV